MRIVLGVGSGALVWGCAAMMGAATGAAQEAKLQAPQPPQLQDVWQSRAAYRETNMDQLVRDRLAKNSALRGYQLSPAERRALQALQVAASSTDAAKGPPALAAASKVVQSADGRFVLGALQMQMGAQANDTAMQAAGTDIVIESGAAPAGVLPKLLRNQGTFALDANDLGKAEAAFGKLVALAPGDADAAIALAQIKVDLRKDQEALKLFEQAIAAKGMAGQEVPPVWMRAAESTRRRVAKAAPR